MSTFEGIYARAEKARSLDELNIGSFFVDKRSGSFFQFNNLASTQEWELTGWKFHLSVLGDDVPHATEIVAGICKKHGVNVFKVANPDVAMKFQNPAMANGQLGKSFTLYDTGEGKWPDIIQEIEQKFLQEKIRAGHPVAGDKHVPGSGYAYYRNDGNFPGGGYVAANEIANMSEEQRYNPLSVKDPFRNFSIQHQQSPRSGSRKMNGFDIHSVYHDLRAVLGADVLGVAAQVRPDGRSDYIVCVPGTFSREEFERVGIDPSSLRRKRLPAGNHQVTVPFEQLPPSMKRDAEFFRRLSELDIPIHDAHRLGSGSQVNAYAVEVPATLSREQLLPLGVDIQQIDRVAGSKNDLHRLTIPVSALPDSIKNLAPRHMPQFGQKIIRAVKNFGFRPA